MGVHERRTWVYGAGWWPSHPDRQSTFYRYGPTTPGGPAAGGDRRGRAHRVRGHAELRPRPAQRDRVAAGALACRGGLGRAAHMAPTTRPMGHDGADHWSTQGRLRQVPLGVDVDGSAAARTLAGGSSGTAARHGAWRSVSGSACAASVIWSPGGGPRTWRPCPPTSTFTYWPEGGRSHASTTPLAAADGGPQRALPWTQVMSTAAPHLVVDTWESLAGRVGRTARRESDRDDRRLQRWAWPPRGHHRPLGPRCRRGGTRGDAAVAPGTPPRRAHRSPDLDANGRGRCLPRQLNKPAGALRPSPTPGTHRAGPNHGRGGTTTSHDRLGRIAQTRTNSRTTPIAAYTYDANANGPLSPSTTTST